MTARSASIPAPVGGLNDRDSIADMSKTDALELTNWWTYPSFVAVRKGSINHVTGISATVETLVEYLPTSGNSTLFAAAGTAIYDVTAAGAVGAAVQSGLTNARWQEAGITTPGGSFLYLVNGEDSPRLWDGATWVSVTGVSTPAITGVTTSDLVHVCLFKNRLFFVEKNSMNVYYLPVNSIGGAASLIDLGSIFRLGGYVMACYTWTIDAGNGSDDHLIVISSNGEIAVYRGTDPSSANTWGIVGVFVLGKPISRRCAVKFGGDLAVLTTEGVFPLGKSLLSASVDRRVALTDKIQNSTSNDILAYGTNFGWQLATYPDANMLLLNIPKGNGVNFQYAQNTITGAWAKFEGWNASVLLAASTGLYYGDANSIKKAWTTTLDITTPITATLSQAFTKFGNPAQNKYFTMIRPYILTTGSPSVLYGVNVDYAIGEATGSLPISAPTGMVWGSMTWGSMTWGGAATPVSVWVTVGQIGTAAGLKLVAQNNGAYVQLNNADYLYKTGGVL